MTSTPPPDDQDTPFHATARLPDELLEGLTPEQAQRLRTAATTTARLTARSRQPGTLKAYRSAWKQWKQWTSAHGTPSLPAAPGVLASYLAEQALALRPDGQPLLDDHGQPVRGRLAPSSLEQHVAAINRAHIAAGHPPPGQEPDVKDVIRGAHALFPPGPARNDPLNPDQLRAALTAQPPSRRADLLLLVLAAADLSAATMAGLDSEHLAPSPDPDGETADGLLVGGPGKGMALAAERLPVPVSELLARLRPGPVLQHPDGSRYTRQGVTAHLRTLADRHGLPLPPTGPPRPDPTGLARAAERMREPGDDPRTARDRSIVAALYANALRPSAVGPVGWNHTRPHPAPTSTPPVLVHLTGEKQDRTRRGSTVPLEPTGNPTGPAETWWNWHAARTEQTITDPLADRTNQPCWPRLNPGGTAWTDPETGQPAPLSATAVGEVVKRLMRHTDIPGNWQGGSARSGALTALAEQGAPAQDLALKGRHKTLRSMLAYVRPRPGANGRATRLGM